MTIYACLFNICQTKLAKLVGNNKGLQASPRRVEKFCPFLIFMQTKSLCKQFANSVKKGIYACWWLLYLKLFFFFSFFILIFHLAFFHIALAMSTNVVFMAFLIRHLRYFRLGTFCDQHKLGLCLVERAYPRAPSYNPPLSIPTGHKAIRLLLLWGRQALAVAALVRGASLASSFALWNCVYIKIDCTPFTSK